MSQQALLNAGLKQAGLALSEATVQTLLAYLALIQKWNKVHNLTAVRDPDEMVTLHLLDSLVVLPYITGKRLLDVGSGAGLPGIVLAICKPELKVTTIDSVSKKASFMRQAKAELGLSNLEVVAGRVEQLKPAEPFDIVISRAFSDLNLFLSLTQHLIAKSGLWLAMKGVYPHEELAQISLTPTQVLALQVPGLAAQRHLVFLENKAA
jgi:16S rRNA (guanine527-N7)-methyltransferase